MTPIYNYQYVKKHGYFKWVFFGEFIATYYAFGWPYYYFNDPIANKTDIQQYNYINEEDNHLWEVRNKKMYLIDSNSPFSGKSFVLGLDSTKISERTWKDGKKNGVTTFWYENGQKKESTNYKDDLKSGLQVKWYENGKKMEEAFFVYDKQDGLRKGWDEKGYPTYEGIWNKGTFSGLWNVWYENGEKWKEMKYENGEVISMKEWNEDGSLKE